MNNKIIEISCDCMDGDMFYTYAQPLNYGLLVITKSSGAMSTTYLPNGYYIDYDENSYPFIKHMATT